MLEVPNQKVFDVVSLGCYVAKTSKRKQNKPLHATTTTTTNFLLSSLWLLKRMHCISQSILNFSIIYIYIYNTWRSHTLCFVFISCSKTRREYKTLPDRCLSFNGWGCFRMEYTLFFFFSVPYSNELYCYLSS